MPRVMISGWTLNTPTPMPFTMPAIERGDQRPGRSPTTGPGRPVWVAMMNAAIEATVPTDRSMPPVSMRSVWHAGEDRERDGGPDRRPDPVLR